MKKIIMFCLTFVLILILNKCVSYQSNNPMSQKRLSSNLSTKNIMMENEAAVTEDNEEKINPYQYMDLDALPYDYSFDMAKANKDVVWTHRKSYNFHRLENFISNVESNVKDMIRVVGFTKEGDAIIHDLKFDGETIKLTKDNRRDEFSENPSLKIYEYKKIVICERYSKDYNGFFIEYVLKNSDDNSGLVIAQLFKKDE